MVRHLCVALVVSCAACASSASALVLTTTGDVSVDRNAPATNFDGLQLQVQTQGGGTSNPRKMGFVQFTLGNTQAASVRLSARTAGGTNGSRFVGGYMFAKAFSFDQTTLTYNNSFLSAMPGGTVTLADVTSYIASQGWTQLDPGDGTNVLFQLGQGVADTVFDTSGLPALETDLKNFYNANLGSTISLLFVSSAPINGNQMNWRDMENAAVQVPPVPPYFQLAVVEVPEPAAAVLLAMGALLVRPRRRTC